MTSDDKKTKILRNSMFDAIIILTLLTLEASVIPRLVLEMINLLRRLSKFLLLF